MFKKLTLSILTIFTITLTACAQEEEPPPPPPHSHTTLNPETTITEWFTALQRGDAEQATNLILPSINTSNINYTTDYSKTLHILPQQTLNPNMPALLINSTLENTLVADRYTITPLTTPTATTTEYDILVEYTIGGRNNEMLFTAYRLTPHYWILQGGYDLIEIQFNEYTPEYVINNTTITPNMLLNTLTPNIKTSFIFTPVDYTITLPTSNPNFTLTETPLRQHSIDNISLKPQRIETLQNSITEQINTCLTTPRETKPTNCPNWYYSPINYVQLNNSRWIAGTPQFNLNNIFTNNTPHVNLTLNLTYSYEQYVDERRGEETQTLTREETIQRSAQIINRTLNSRGELEIEIQWDRTPPTPKNPTTPQYETNITYNKYNWM